MNLKTERIIAAVLLLFFFLRCFDAADKKSITYDELSHIPAGYLYVLTGDYSVNPEHPPLSKILAGISLLLIGPVVPDGYIGAPDIHQWRFGSDFFRRNRDSINAIVFMARLPLILLGLALGFWVYSWSRGLYGRTAGLASLFFYSFCPNILAHTPLANTDLGATAFIFLTMFMVYLFRERKEEKYIYLAGISFGLALAAKFTSPFVILPSLGLILAQYAISGGRMRRLYSYLPGFLLALGISFAVLFAFYGFVNSGWYFVGLRSVIFDAGATGRQTYLNGQFSDVGFRSYYLFAFLFKTPVPFMILLLGSFFYGIKRKDAFLLYPVVLLFIIASFSKMQLGIRYILPIYPFLFVFAGRVFSSGSMVFKRKHLKTAVIAILIIWQAFTSLRYHPSYLAYFNEFAGGARHGHRHLLDSNIDWGQDLKALKVFLEREGNPDLALAYFGSIDPEVYGIIHQPLFPVGSFTYRLNSFPPEKEYLAVNLNHLYGLYLVEDFFRWLRPLDPEITVGYSIYVYDITEDIYIRRHLYDAYAYMGFDSMAERERAIIELLEAQDEE